VATGFIFYDMAYYMANAREHFDQVFRLTYGNPYAFYGTPAIYFQPQTFLLGCLQHLGLDPGLALNLFGLAALFFAAWVAVRFYEEVVGLHSTAQRIGLVCFFWGGGILSLAGVAAGRLQHKPVMDSILTFDISGGWWMFNFGRNLTYPTEAYYHGIFLLSLLYLLRRRFAAALALAALLSLSHPFTGLTLALILTTYSTLESWLKSSAVTAWVWLGSAAILVGHLTYYLMFLNRFADHRNLQSQWEMAWAVMHTSTRDWLYTPSTYIPALMIVGILAVMRLLRPPGLREALKDSRVRLFLVWFLVVFALTQHNLIVKPRQPVHFAHGYDWMALFFLGAPVLVQGVERLLLIRVRQLRYAAITLLVTFVLLDNLIWYGSFFSPARKSQAITLTQDQKAVLEWLDRNTAPPEMVVCQDELVSYLVSTYTRVRSWEGHRYNTPSIGQRHADVEQAFLARHLLPEWDRMPVLYVVLRSNTNWSPPPGTAELYRNNQFGVWGRP
ncbi:MAG TPA: hypothetical protein VI685_11415, partial [Candidatus Angelobacter sp.]